MLSSSACERIKHYTIIMRSAHLTQMCLLAFRMRFICCVAAGLSPGAVRGGAATADVVVAQAWRTCSPEPAAEAQRHEHGVRTNRLGCFLGFCFLKRSSASSQNVFALTPSERTRYYCLAQAFCSRTLCSFFHHSPKDFSLMSQSHSSYMPVT